MARWVKLAAVALGSAVAWVLLLPAAPLEQPIAFNHARHAGMACATCHRGVETTARAEIPSGETCLKCHATAPRGAPPEIWAGLARGAAIRWIAVTRVPDHVAFSHRRHVTLGRVDCASCHADIGQRTSPPGAAPVRLDMDGCISCHARGGAPADCASCHR